MLIAHRGRNQSAQRPIDLKPDIRFAIELAQLPFFIAGIWFGLRAWGGITGSASINQPFVADVVNLTVLILAGVVGYFVILFALDQSGFRDVVRMAWHIMLPRRSTSRCI